MKNVARALCVAGLGCVPTGAFAAPEEVMIMHFQFMPEDITVEVGTTVRWTNLDAIEHSVTSQTGPGTLVPDGVFDRYLNEGETFAYTFDVVGVYDYFCVPHGSSMQGVVRVVAGQVCVSDFDGDSDTDSDDVIGFFVAWEQGDEMADVDADGDTDSDDVIVFFTAWDGGC